MSKRNQKTLNATKILFEGYKVTDFKGRAKPFVLRAKYFVTLYKTLPRNSMLSHFVMLRLLECNFGWMRFLSSQGKLTGKLLKQLRQIYPTI